MSLSRTCSRIVGFLILVSLALVAGSLASPGGISPTPREQGVIAFPHDSFTAHAAGGHPASTPMATAGRPGAVALTGNNTTKVAGLVNGTSPGLLPVPVPVPVPIPVGACDDARAGGFVELGDTEVTFGSMVRDPSLAAYACDVELESPRMHAVENSEHAHPHHEPNGEPTWEWKTVGNHDDTYTLTRHHEETGSR